MARSGRVSATRGVKDGLLSRSFSFSSQQTENFPRALPFRFLWRSVAIPRVSPRRNLREIQLQVSTNGLSVWEHRDIVGTGERNEKIEQRKREREREKGTERMLSVFIERSIDPPTTFGLYH